MAMKVRRPSPWSGEYALYGRDVTVSAGERTYLGTPLDLPLKTELYFCQQLVETMKVDETTGNDIAGRMTQLHTEAVKVNSEAQAMMRNAQFDTKLPFQVSSRSRCQ